ncbi:unnamed protein product [Gadus morhua 'NCC']
MDMERRIKQSFSRTNEDGEYHRMAHLWIYLGNLKNRASGTFKFPKFFKVAQIVLSMPHSNANAERTFSLIGLNKTDPGIPPDALRQRYGCGTERLRLCPACISTGRVTAAQLLPCEPAVFTRDHAIILNLMYSPSTPKTTAIKCHALSFRPLPL